MENWRTAITARARRHSIFVAYNGGHTLPAVLPSGVSVDSDPCSKELAGGTFTDLTIRFLDEQLKGRHTGLRGYGAYHLATPDSTCTTVLGQIACYTGKQVSWDQILASDYSYEIKPEECRDGMDAPVRPGPDGRYTVPVPGRTKMV